MAGNVTKAFKLLLTLLLLAPLPTLGDELPAAAEERVDDGLKNFGYLAGLTRGCLVDAQVEELEREVLDLHGTVGRLLGTDRAFLFAAAFGYGTSVLTAQEDCASVVARYEARVESFRGGSGAQP